MGFRDFELIHWTLFLWPVPLLFLVVALFLVKRKTGLQGWRRMVPGNVGSGIAWIAGGASRMVGWIAKKIPWKPLLIWGPWVVIVPLAGFLGIENWRGSRALETVRSDWRVRGEKLRVEEFLPGPIPDDENFAEHPAVHVVSQPTPHYGDPLHRVRQVAGAHSLGDLWNGNPDLGIHENVDHWLPRSERTSDEASAALHALELIEPDRKAVNGFAEALRRPGCVFDLKVDRFYVVGGWSDPVSSSCWIFSSVFAGRAVLHVRLGDGERAMEDLDSLLLFARMMRSNPTLTGVDIEAWTAVRIAAPLWEGLWAEVWNEDQLKQLDGRIAEFDFLKRGHAALKCEIVHLAAVYADAASDRGALARSIDPLEWLVGRSTPSWWDDGVDLAEEGLVYAMPAGWFDAWLADSMRRFDRVIGRPDGVAADALQAGMASAFERELAELEGAFFGELRGELLAKFPVAINRMIAVQGKVDLMRVAVALERFRLRTGEYPHALDELVPGELPELPVDLVTGEALRYRLKRDGTPLVYSVGFNGVDDGGVPARFPQHLDWVWQYTGTPGQTEADWSRGRAPKKP